MPFCKQPSIFSYLQAVELQSFQEIPCLPQSFPTKLSFCCPVGHFPQIANLPRVRHRQVPTGQLGREETPRGRLVAQLKTSEGFHLSQRCNQHGTHRFPQNTYESVGTLGILLFLMIFSVCLWGLLEEKSSSSKHSPFSIVTLSLGGFLEFVVHFHTVNHTVNNEK